MSQGSTQHRRSAPVPGSQGASRAARLAVLGVLAAAVVVAAWVLLRASHPYEITARFADAGQLVKGDQVRLGAAPVGSVERIGLADNGVVDLKLRLRGPAAPLPRGTKATIRIDGLAGVANRYVSLDFPLGKQPTIPDGGVLTETQTEAPVDLDALLDSLDTPTRNGLASLVRGGAQQYEGRAEAARVTLQRFAPALTGTADLAHQFTRDRTGFNDLLQQGAVAMHALNSRRSQLTDLVANAQVTTQALADEQGSLNDALVRLPGVLTHGSRTVATLRSSVTPLTRLVDVSKPSAPRLAGFFAQLHGLVSTGAAPLRRLADTVDAPGVGNDLTGLLRDAPRLERVTRTAFPRAIRTMDASRDQLAALRAYSPDLFGALTHLGQATANQDANGHYARIQPDLLAFDYDAARNTLEKASGGNALTRLQTGRGARCPGGVIESDDPSQPLRVPGCDPKATVGSP